MSPASKHRTGHLRRKPDETRTYCGRTALPGCFDDPDNPPRDCQVCIPAFMREQGADHSHQRWNGECWVIAVPTARYAHVGQDVISQSTPCGIDGCQRMVPNILIPIANTGSCSNVTVIWAPPWTGDAA